MYLRLVSIALRINLVSCKGHIIQETCEPISNVAHQIMLTLRQKARADAIGRLEDGKGREY
jgi:hypothetical protein